MTSVEGEDDTRVIDLSQAAGRREAWDRSAWQVYLWTAAELLFVTNPWQPSSSLRRRVLQAFGAKIGSGVVLRPRLRVKFPWKLEVGNHSWIGEDVWIHNQARVTIGSDSVISQGSFITTGTHKYRGDMSLETVEVVIERGVWITARCVILAGSVIGRSAIILPQSVVRGNVASGTMFGGNPASWKGQRFLETNSHEHPS